MNRAALISQLDRPTNDPWDLIIIGGGATGAGAALSAVARGYSCLLLEQYDFGKGTSSRSTKLIHGGVRYLAQGNVSLVREALRERTWLVNQAPSVVQPLRFVVPCYSHQERWYYWAGMKCYDALAGSAWHRPSAAISSADVRAGLPGLRHERLRGGVAYYDAQFDDTGLLIAVLQYVANRGAVPLNYFRVGSLLYEQDKVCGVRARDEESGAEYELRARSVVNAAGPSGDIVRGMDRAASDRMILHSQGVHLVVDDVYGGADALMIPKTQDGRVLFAIPWFGKTVLGTTDTPIAEMTTEPRAQEEEIEYLISHFADYVHPAPKRRDVRSVFVGVRPLLQPQKSSGSTAKVSREHSVIASPSGLVNVIGGKWTTFRKMGVDVVDVAEEVGDLKEQRSAPEEVHFGDAHYTPFELQSEGIPASLISRACDEAFARTVEDVLARRLRLLFLDARRSMELAPTVAEQLAAHLGHPTSWARQQTDEYRALARGYLLD